MTGARNQLEPAPASTWTAISRTEEGWTGRPKRSPASATPPHHGTLPASQFRAFNFTQWAATIYTGRRRTLTGGRARHPGRAPRWARGHPEDHFC